MKKLILHTFILFSPFWLKAQNVSINEGGALPDSSAMLDVSSTSSGVLIPRMRQAQRNALVNPANSLLIYQMDNTPGYYFNSGTSLSPVWTQLRTSGDDLGNHIASQNIELAGNYLSGDGDNEGVFVTNGGNVGIGTTNPSRKVQVHDSTAGSSFAQYTTDFTGQNAVDGFIMGYADFVGAALFNAENSNMAFGTNSSYRMWLDPDGDLGVGTSAPLARLHLNGTALATAIIESSNTSGTWTAMNNSSTGGQHYQLISTGSANGEGAGKLLFSYGTSASFSSGVAMTIHDREVGIGTSDPETAFHVNHPTGVTNGFSLSNSSGGADRWHFYVFTTDDLTLYFNGNQRGAFNSLTGVYASTSDVRLKKNISNSSPLLSRVKNLSVKEYQYKTQADSDPKTIGFIAQELEKEFPSLVTHSNADGEDTYLVNYSGFGPIAIKAIQEQQEIIDQLVNKLDALEQELIKLKKAE